MSHRPQVNFNLLQAKKEELLQAEHDLRVIDPQSLSGTAAIAYLKGETAYDEVDTLARHAEGIMQSLVDLPLTSGTAQYVDKHGTKLSITKTIPDEEESYGVINHHLAITNPAQERQLSLSLSSYEESDFGDVRVQSPGEVDLSFERDAESGIWRLRQHDARDIVAIRQAITNADNIIQSYGTVLERVQQRFSSDIHAFTVQILNLCRAENAVNFQLQGRHVSYRIAAQPPTQHITFIVALSREALDQPSSTVAYNVETDGSVVITQLTGNNLDLNALTKVRRSLVINEVVRRIFNFF